MVPYRIFRHYNDPPHPLRPDQLRVRQWWPLLPVPLRLHCPMGLLGAAIQIPTSLLTENICDMDKPAQQSAFHVQLAILIEKVPKG